MQNQSDKPSSAEMQRLHEILSRIARLPHYDESPSWLTRSAEQRFGIMNLIRKSIEALKNIMECTRWHVESTASESGANELNFWQNIQNRRR